MESDLMRQMVTLMLPSPDALRLDTLLLDVDHNRVILEVASMQDVLTYPSCGLAAGRIHSYYNRKLADLAWAEISVCLHLQVRKCYCSNRVCTQRVFMERLPLVAAPWARRTQRLAAQQRAVGLALGGAPSARLSDALACPTSRDTFLRLVRAAPTATAPTPRYLGVDDWALRKGHTYGNALTEVFDQKRAVIEQNLSVAAAVTAQDASAEAAPTVSHPLPPTASAVTHQDAASDDAVSSAVLAPAGGTPPPSAPRSQSSKRQ